MSLLARNRGHCRSQEDRLVRVRRLALFPLSPYVRNTQPYSSNLSVVAVDSTTDFFIPSLFKLGTTAPR